MREKITEDHLRRQAYVYVRQSSLRQVRYHQESGRVQYRLAAKAEELGWNQVEVIDEDQGRSGGHYGRSGGLSTLVPPRSAWDGAGPSSVWMPRDWLATMPTGTDCWTCAR